MSRSRKAKENPNGLLIAGGLVAAGVVGYLIYTGMQKTGGGGGPPGSVPAKQNPPNRPPATGTQNCDSGWTFDPSTSSCAPPACDQGEVYDVDSASCIPYCDPGWTYSMETSSCLPPNPNDAGGGGSSV